MQALLEEVKKTTRWITARTIFRHKQSLPKQSLEREKPENAQPDGISVVILAVVLDGEVQEVLRAQDRMAALFLSAPTFVEIDDLTYASNRPSIGWKYEDGKFISPTNSLMDGIIFEDLSGKSE